FSWLAGRFDTVSGHFTFDPATVPQGQSITVEIDPASVDTNFAERDKHLRSERFLDTDKYPKASFVSSGYTGDAKGGILKGILTLHGVSKPIEIKVAKVGEGKDPWGGYRAGFEGSFLLTRSDFGVSYDLGPSAQTMEMSLYVEGIRQ
ncbi:MAG: YceI family protein, partial [Alphaproteobacteria bacterium]|nr:YceI family protein [Alphaproteobacteria bacterium]